METQTVILVVLLVACVHIQTGHGQITLNASVDQEQVPEQALEVAINVIEGESVTFQCAAFPTLSVRPPGSSIFGSTIPPNLRALDPLTFELINISQSDNGSAFQCRGGAGFTDIGVIIVLSAPPTPRPPGGLMVGDPHYSILLPNGQLLCFTVHGQSGFSFNLISNKQMHMNALFIQDPKREEITWIGSLGVVVRGTRYKNSNITKLRFDASEKKIYIGTRVTLLAQKVERLTFSKGKLSIAEFVSKPEHPVVHVDLKDVGLSLTVRFKRFHLDIEWNKVDKQPKDTHGVIGQFFQEEIKIDESRRLLLLGPDMEPVPVMRKPVWSFMERETTPEDQLCWAAMNPGYQGKRLIQGHYLDYLVDDVLSSDFKFGQPRQKKSI